MTDTAPNNVANITDKQQQPACRFTIQASLRGFPITVEGEGRAADLKLIVERLLAAGAEPPQAASAKPEPTNSGSVPVCPTHNSPMAPSTKRPGTYYCKSSVGQAEDGRTLYCTKKA